MPYKGLDLSGKSAVVIGGTTGIGHAISLGLAEAGADVAPTSRRRDLVDQTAEEVRTFGRRAIACPSDVLDRTSLDQVLAESIEAFGKVDIMVNCAGRTKRAPTLDFSEEDWDAILETNLTGTLRAAQVFGRHMLQRGYGRINSHRLDCELRSFVRSRGLCGQQSCGRFVDQVARARVGPARRLRERYRARCLSDRPQSWLAGRHAARA